MNLMLILAAIGLVGLLHVGVGIYGGIRLIKALEIRDWQQTLWISVLTAVLFCAATAGWIALLFVLPRTAAPMAVFNTPIWILLGVYIVVEFALRQAKSPLALAWGGVALAIPACSLFAYVYYEPLKQIFGPIHFH